MGIPMIALAKLNHLVLASRSSSPAVVSFLVWPFLLKLSLSGERVLRGYSDAMYASRLFLFQLRRIALHGGGGGGGSSGGGGGRDHAADTRWERALRLVRQRLISWGRSRVMLVDEDSFHTLSMLAL
ncbi:hypothetical protein EUGRSUZ_D02077 [Eucalyptus grandis]|uniref:Uncharacterized protein n=2 Tax=Eucalyptus grandis TaxID=71139 RepID=A0ACC3L733_EUCGR|nr:hypothetical protein EUGRSUZ_D02077 [Eucalyptus grandis]